MSSGVENRSVGKGNYNEPTANLYRRLERETIYIHGEK